METGFDADKYVEFPYPMFGAPVVTIIPGPIAGKAKDMDKNPVQNEGVLPKDVVVTNANWWARELADYRNEDGCWNVSFLLS